jgi:hypothetical protein
LILSSSASPSKFLGLTSWSTLSGQPALPGFPTSSRQYRNRPLIREHTRSRYVPSSGFLCLSTGYSESGFAGLLHPAATSRLLAVQGFLPICSLPGSSPVRSPITLAPFGSRTTLGRLLPPPVASCSRLCSANRSVRRVRCLASPSVAPLFGFAPPPGIRRLTVNPVPRAIRS